VALFASAYGYSIVQFTNNEANPHSNGINQEYHCLETDSGGNVVYVRGTYGMIGYFEGTVIGQNAYVNYYENTFSGDSYTPTTGSAMLTYNTAWTSFSGSFWAAGSTDLFGTAPWSSTAHASVDASSANAKNWCFWDPTGEFTTANLPQLLNWQLFQNTNDSYTFTPLEEGDVYSGFNTLSELGVGPFDRNGATVGGYVFNYDTTYCHTLSNDCTDLVEFGTYGYDVQTAQTPTARIAVTQWSAISGPIAGQTGPQLMAFMSNGATTLAYSFFCVTATSNDAMYYKNCTGSPMIQTVFQRSDCASRPSLDSELQAPGQQRGQPSQLPEVVLPRCVRPEQLAFLSGQE